MLWEVGTGFATRVQQRNGISVDQAILLDGLSVGGKNIVYSNCGCRCARAYFNIYPFLVCLDSLNLFMLMYACLCIFMRNDIAPPSRL